MNVRKAIQHLREALGAYRERVHDDHGRLRLDVGDAWVDADAFEAHLARGEREEAVALYAAPLASKVTPDLAEEELDALWDHGWAARLDESFRQALVDLAIDSSNQGRRERAADWFERALATNRAHEASYLAYMRHLLDLGQASEAVQVFRRLLQTLDGLGLAPSAEAVDLGRVARARLPRVESRREPGAEALAELRGAPDASTTLFGREALSIEVREALGLDRLVTLLGPGGVGKTRLAIEAGSEAAAERAHGGVWIDLSGLQRAEDVATTIEGRLAAHRGRGGAPLADTDLLIVLDNCEDFVGPVSEWVAKTLERCRRVSVLATSRTPLGMRAERVLQVPPLVLPEEGGTDAPALALFRSRLAQWGSGATAPDDVAAEICRETGGLPLALELAAARSASVGSARALEELASGASELDHEATLGDLPERHRSVGRALETSLALLEASLRELFARASVFPGPFGLDDVSGALDIPESEAADGLAALSQRSFLQREIAGGEARFSMLPPVRRFARSRVDADTRKADLGRHAEYFAEKIRRFVLERRGSGQADLALSVERDDAHFRQAHAVLVEHDPLAALRLASDITMGLVRAGRAAEAKALYDACLGPALVASPEAATLTLNLGSIHRELGDTEAALEAYGRAAAALEGTDAHRDRGACLLNSALAHIDRGEYEPAEECLVGAEAAFHDYAAVAEARDLAYAVNNVTKARARLEMHRRDFERSIELGLRALAEARELGDRHSVWVIEGNLGDASLMTGRLDEARGWYEASIRSAREITEPAGVAHGELGLACVALTAGDGAQAARHALPAARAFASLGAKREALATCYLSGALAPDPLPALRAAYAARRLLDASGLALPPVIRTLAEGPLAERESEVGAEMAERARRHAAAESYASTIALADSGLVAAAG